MAWYRAGVFAGLADIFSSQADFAPFDRNKEPTEPHSVTASSMEQMPSEETAIVRRTSQLVLGSLAQDVITAMLSKATRNVRQRMNLTTNRATPRL
jgi:hypothetical protein